MGNTKKIKRIISISIIVILVGLGIFVSRGPYLSNTLKRIILPEIEKMTGRKVIAQNIYISFLPLFVEAKGLKIFDEEGNRILTIKRVKGYVELSGFLRKEIKLRRIVMKEPEIWADRDQIDDIVANVKKYLATKDPKKIKFRTDAVEVRDGEFSFYDTARNIVITGRQFGGEVLLGGAPRLRIKIKELVSDIKNFPQIKCELSSNLYFKENGIDVKDITIKSYDSELQASGFYAPDDGVVLRTKTDLIVDSVKKLFGLKQRGEGRIFASGDIKFIEGTPSVDLKLKGSFYIQTLMELLKVKDKIEGWVDFSGNIEGAITKLKGSGEARLRNGNLFGVDVTDLKCNVFYGDGIMSFKEGKAVVYNGYADAEASLKIPVVDHYTVKISLKDADSYGVLKIIGWQPDIPKGKVRGEFYTSGSKFNPTGWFDYDGKETSKDVLGRVKKIKGSFHMADHILTLSDTVVRTEKSALGISGAIDISNSMLGLKGRLETVDVTDITAPYFNRLRGQGVIDGTIKGKYDDPLIDGILNMNSAFFDDYDLGNISGNVSYRKNLLQVKELFAGKNNERHSIAGSVRFDNAKKLFDLSGPHYKLDVSLRNADFEKVIKIFYKKLPLKGICDSDFKITGKGGYPAYSGSAALTGAEAYGFPLDHAASDFYYDYKDFIIRKSELKRGGSSLSVNGRISAEEKFSFNLSAARLLLRDLGMRYMPDDTALSVDAEGSGSFENPSITFNGKLSGGTFKGKPLGDGTIKASVKNKSILLDALLFNRKMKLKGEAYWNDKLPWKAEIDMSSGRYDFLLFSFLKDMPEDLLVNLKAHADLSGDRKHVAASAVVSHLNVALYGNSFANDSDIRLRIDDRKITFSEFTMRGGNTSFNVHGDMEIGKEYNIILRGNSALSPLKAFSKNISVLRGDTDFSLTIAGRWENPQINGSLNVMNASLGLKATHQRLSSINGQFYFEGERIIIQRLTGKVGGGDADVSGLIYLKGFGVKRFYLDAKVNNITTSVSRDFTVNFDGDIIYKGTLDSQNITGDLKIKRAAYKERVEWKSWLLKARPTEKPKAELKGIEKAVLNVKIYGARNIIVDNNMAKSFLKVDMVLRGTVGHPALFGRIETKEGKVYFRNNEFRIINASADFADPNRINPVIEIVAQTIVKGYNIKLSLDGQIDRFNLSLISDPPLDETDILSLLTVGEMGRELKGLEGGIGASEATAFITGKAQDVFEERLRDITGFDRVQVDPYVSKTTGTVGPRVTVSKRLMGDKLFVTYISSVGSTEEQVIKLEYILGRNVSLVGLRDEKGGVGGDIKFRFEFK